MKTPEQKQYEKGRRLRIATFNKANKLTIGSQNQDATVHMIVRQRGKVYIYNTGPWPSPEAPVTIHFGPRIQPQCMYS
jgi:hypothetical protein